MCGVSARTGVWLGGQGFAALAVLVAYLLVVGQREPFGVPQHRRRGAQDDHGVFVQRADDDRRQHFPGVDRTPGHRFAQRGQQDLARRREVAAEDDQLRVEQVVHVGGRQADVPAGVGDHPPAADVAHLCQLDHVGDR